MNKGDRWVLHSVTPGSISFIVSLLHKISVNPIMKSDNTEIISTSKTSRFSTALKGLLMDLTFNGIVWIKKFTLLLFREYLCYIFIYTYLYK